MAADPSNPPPAEGTIGKLVATVALLIVGVPMLALTACGLYVGVAGLFASSSDARAFTAVAFVGAAIGVVVAWFVGRAIRRVWAAPKPAPDDTTDG